MTTIDRQRIRHFQKESESWKRLLEYIQQENSYLKDLLADIVSQDINRELLGRAEEFQNQFITKDEMIALLRGDIYDFEQWLLNLASHYKRNINEYLEKQRKLRNEIESLEQRFNKLKFEFLNYVSEKI